MRRQVKQHAEPATSGVIFEVNEWTMFRWDVQRERSKNKLRVDNVVGDRADLLISVGPDGEPKLSIVGPESFERQI